MSEENLEVIRRLYRTMNAWVSDERTGEEPVRGRDNVLQYFSDQAEVFEDARLETERIFEADDQVLVFVRVTGSGTGSGARFEIRIAHLWTLSDGQLVRGEAYADRDKALEAAGLEE